jgi:SAM-dependent methyltransferase
VTKQKILCGVTDDDAWRKSAEQDIQNIFKNDFAVASGDVILEFGSGIGRITSVLAERFDFKKIVGLDVGRHTIEYASEKIRDPRISYILYDGGVTLPFESDSFDKEYSVLTIQHLDRHSAYFVFQDLVRVLKPEGKAVLRIENWSNGRQSIIESWSDAAAADVAGIEHHWIELYTEEELRHIFLDWLKVENLKIEPWSYGGELAPYFRVFFEKPQHWKNKRFSSFRANLDSPTDQMVCRGGACEVSGWAFSTLGIESVVIQADGNLKGRSECSFERPDVAEEYGTIGLRSGFRSVLQLDEGVHTVEVIVRDKAGAEKAFIRTVQVTVSKEPRVQ